MAFSGSSNSGSSQRPSFGRSASVGPGFPRRHTSLSPSAAQTPSPFRQDPNNPSIVHGPRGSGLYYDLAGAKGLNPGIGPSGFQETGNYPEMYLPNGTPNPEYFFKSREILEEDYKSYTLRGHGSWQPGQPSPPQVRQSVAPVSSLASSSQSSGSPSGPSYSNFARPSTPPVPMVISRPSSPTPLSRPSSRSQMPPPPLPRRGSFGSASLSPSAQRGRGPIGSIRGRGRSMSSGSSSLPPPNTLSPPSSPPSTGTGKPTLPSLKRLGLLDIGRGKNMPGGSEYRGPSGAGGSYGLQSPSPAPMRPSTPPQLQRRLSASGNALQGGFSSGYSAYSGPSPSMYQNQGGPTSPPQFLAKKYPTGSSISSSSTPSSFSYANSLPRPSSSLSHRSSSNFSRPTPIQYEGGGYMGSAAIPSSYFDARSNSGYSTIGQFEDAPSASGSGSGALQWDPSLLIGNSSAPNASSRLPPRRY